MPVVNHQKELKPLMVGRFFFLLFIFGGVIDYSYLCNRKEIFDLLRMNGLQIMCTNARRLHADVLGEVVNSLQIATTYTRLPLLPATV